MAPAARLRLLGRLRAERWKARARPEQLPPDGPWRVWYVRGGRGAGKTRTGAETLADWILSYPPGDWAIVAPTFGDARDVCVESESGLLAALAGAVAKWNRSTGEVRVSNGSRVFLDGADDGALRVQGKNLRGAWCDEVGLWSSHGWRRAWQESLQFAVRHAPAKIVATGTPKAGHGLVKLLIADPSVVVTLMRTMDNAENLDAATLDELVRLYGGGRLGRQELEAELLDEAEGALWRRARLELDRVVAYPELREVVVAVDPNASSSEAANSGGIVVAGRAQTGTGYVLADRTTTSGGPRAWAQAAVDAYHEFEADRIVAEANNGGEMVALTIKMVDPTVPVKLVHASRGKRVRAEPIAVLYEEDPPRVRHVGAFPDLEDQMVTWTPEAESPDRMDALVWALSELMLKKPLGKSRGSVPRGTIPISGSYGGGFAGR